MCLELCAASQKLEMSHIAVNDATPRYLWLRRKQETPREKPRYSRIPVVRASSIMWLSSANGISEGRVVDNLRISLASRLNRLRSSRDRSKDVSAAWWPESLRKMEFGPRVNNPVDSIIWPALSEHLVFDRYFDQPYHGVGWSPSLKHLTFRDGFKQAIQGIV